LTNTPETNFSFTNPNSASDNNNQASQGIDWGRLGSDFSNGVNQAVDGAGKAWQAVKGLFGGQ
ncbi:MAG TPA: hypothetical protein DEW45_04530, partial [Leuconostoc lactis]|nr:hypothetical protein [Leuconostoc lactis]